MGTPNAVVADNDAPGSRFDNTYSRLPEVFFAAAKPAMARAPRVSILNRRLAAELEAVQDAAVAELQGWEDWAKVTPEDQQSIIDEANLSPRGAPDVSTTAKLLVALDDSSLRSWHDRISLVPGRRDQARLRAAKALEPDSVSITPPSATIKSEADLEAYLDELRKRVQSHLDGHKTVII